MQDTGQLNPGGSESLSHPLCCFVPLQVLMKDIVTPVPPEEVKGVIRKCLEQAAQLNYQRIKEYAKIEGKSANDAYEVSMETHSEYFPPSPKDFLFF